MPLRDFKCSYCGHEWETLLKMSESDPTACPLCEKENTIIRKLAAPSVMTGTRPLPHFNVAVNPSGKTHEERFKITEKKPEKNQ